MLYTANGKIYIYVGGKYTLLEIDKTSGDLVPTKSFLYELPNKRFVEIEEAKKIANNDSNNENSNGNKSNKLN